MSTKCGSVFIDRTVKCRPPHSAPSSLWLEWISSDSNVPLIFNWISSERRRSRTGLFSSSRRSMKFDNNSANRRFSTKFTLQVEPSVLNPTINFSFRNSNLKDPKRPSALDVRREIRTNAAILKHEMNEMLIKCNWPSPWQVAALRACTSGCWRLDVNRLPCTRCRTSDRPTAPCPLRESSPQEVSLDKKTKDVNVGTQVPPVGLIIYFLFKKKIQMYKQLESS